MLFYFRISFVRTIKIQNLGFGTKYLSKFCAFVLNLQKVI